jgi:hypothetical protein
VATSSAIALTNLTSALNLSSPPSFLTRSFSCFFFSSSAISSDVLIQCIQLSFAILNFSFSASSHVLNTAILKSLSVGSLFNFLL